MRKILLAEDEPTLRTIVSETLSDEGYEVVCANDGEMGLKLFATERPELIIADVMMPRMDGFEMARRIRKINQRVPLLFLTARGAINDMEEGFELGADDYIKKPFKMRELIIRIKSLIRRGYDEADDEPNPRGRLIMLGKYVFDAVGNRLNSGQHEIELSNIESMILAYLAEREGETVRSSELMEYVWKLDNYYNRNSLHVFIHKLRKHLRHDTRVQIVNLRGIGYRLVIRGEGDSA